MSSISHEHVAEWYARRDNGWIAIARQLLDGTWAAWACPEGEAPLPMASISKTDDPGVRCVVRSMLEEIGCVVHEAVNGRQALESLESELPDVIFLDMLLPDMGGLDVMVRLRSTGIPVVAITGSLIPSEAPVRPSR